jgi:hypothetical protein
LRRVVSSPSSSSHCSTRYCATMFLVS